MNFPFTEDWPAKNFTLGPSKFICYGSKRLGAKKKKIHWFGMLDLYTDELTWMGNQFIFERQC